MGDVHHASEPCVLNSCATCAMLSSVMIGSSGGARARVCVCVHVCVCVCMCV